MTSDTAMNRLFLLLPVISEDRTYIHSYLNVYSRGAFDELDQLVNQLTSALFIINHENYNGYYDQEIFRSFYLAVRETLGGDAAKLLMAELNDWSDYHLAEGLASEAIYVNAVRLCDDILCACRVCGSESTFIGSRDTLSCSHKAFRIVDENDKVLSFPFLEYKEKTLFEWFVEHRSPQRVLDRNYRKHSVFRKEGPRGVISPLSYDYGKAQAFLYRAVCEKKGTRLCHWLKNERKVLVFFHENLHNPTYHAYEISEDQEGELNKLSADTRKKMKRVADL